MGMALKEEGYSCADWDAWSAKDLRRYHAGECAKKWSSFQGAESPVTGGTIYQMAVDRGWQPDRGYELDWDSTIDTDGIVVDQNWIENRDVSQPDAWHPAQQLITYLETLFEPGETVGFVTRSWRNDKGKYIPKDKGCYDKTAGQLIEELNRHGDDISYAVGDYDKGGGAWIRFNPLDGKGVKNENVTEFRYALVESDDMEIEKQNALIRELELPIAVLVHSGGKSLHAIVRIDAADYGEYRKRVDYLYDVCEKNGMVIDKQNRNPSRLSRMPGCVRGSQKQYIVETNIGKSSWQEWHDWIEAVNDNLPDIDDLAAEWDKIPELAPALIDGLLREGHKMLISGPSKAGKSFALIELVVAIAEGRRWLGWQCRQGRVLYVNLELDRASCLNRFRDVYTAMGWNPQGLKNIDIWNLRGKAVPMDKLAPKLIRRAKKRSYKAIIIDPIYKVITGDENSADQMARFCNQFDLVCTELSCAVVYCHHHSKGAQGQKKAIDRASGSGVFSRDPDAVLDLIGLDVTDDMMLQQENKGVCRAVRKFLETHYEGEISLSEDDMLSSHKILAWAENTLDTWQIPGLRRVVEQERRTVRNMSPWRIEATLREFPRFDPVDLWFRYPIHYLDESGTLKDADPDGPKVTMRKLTARRKVLAKERAVEYRIGFDLAFEGLQEDGCVRLQDLAEQIGVDAKTVGSWFGKGRRSRATYKDDYELFSDEETGMRYLKKRESRDA